MLSARGSGGSDRGCSCGGSFGGDCCCEVVNQCLWGAWDVFDEDVQGNRGCFRCCPVDGDAGQVLGENGRDAAPDCGAASEDAQGGIHGVILLIGDDFVVPLVVAGLNLNSGVVRVLGKFHRGGCSCGDADVHAHPVVLEPPCDGYLAVGGVVPQGCVRQISANLRGDAHAFISGGVSGQSADGAVHPVNDRAQGVVVQRGHARGIDGPVGAD